MKVAFPMIVAGVKTRKDRSLRIELDTPEMNPTDAAQVLALAHDQGWAVLSPNDDITETDIPEVTVEVGDTKTPSQRLRSVLYIYWEQNGKPGTWESFYLNQMERMVDAIKEKLEEK